MRENRGNRANYSTRGDPFLRLRTGANLSRQHSISMQYTAITRQIRVSVEPIWLEDQSSPAESRYVWAYQVRIENLGQETVQLRSRHWMITDARGQVEHVRGPGVVGKQPTLDPGDAFEYTSGAPLTTPSGFMGGTYRMVTSSGESFDIEIPTFSLDSPHQRIVVN